MQRTSMSDARYDRYAGKRICRAVPLCYGAETHPKRARLDCRLLGRCCGIALTGEMRKGAVARYALSH